MEGFLSVFGHPFHFESNSTLEEVIQALQKENQGFFKNVDDSMHITPLSSGFAFRYDVLDRFRGKLETRAFARGKVWLNQNQLVIVEGTASIDPTLSIVLIILGIFGLLLELVITGSFAGSLLFLVAAGITMYVHCEARNRILEILEDAVMSTVKK